MLTRAEIINEVRSYVGTPMCHRGRIRGGGIDCIGLVVCVGMAFGTVQPQEDDNQYSIGLVPAVLLGRLRNSRFIELPPAQAQPGDIVCFEVLGEGHCGFLTDYGMVHVFGTAGKVVEHGYVGTVWERRAMAAFKFPEVL